MSEAMFLLLIIILEVKDVKLIKENLILKYSKMEVKLVYNYIE